jgi:hypothetical protein
VSTRGSILSADTSGKLQINSKLSGMLFFFSIFYFFFFPFAINKQKGMPTCTIGMNDRVALLAQQDGRRRMPSSGESSKSGIAIDSFTFHQYYFLLIAFFITFY